MPILLRPWDMLWVLISLCIILGGAVAPASAQITQPESLSAISRVLKEVRAFKNSNARLEAIKRFDDLILTSDAATRAIEQCNETEFKILRRRIVDVVVSTTAARRRIAKLEKRRREDVKRLENETTARWRSWRTNFVSWRGRTYSKAVKKVFDDAYFEASRGNPQPLSLVLRTALATVKSAEKQVSKTFDYEKKLEREIFFIRKLEGWEKEITNPEAVAAIAMLHELARARIRTAKRVLKWMDKSFAKHACVRCVDKKKKVVATPVKSKRTGVWKAVNKSPQMCVIYKPGKVIITYPGGRKVTVSYHKKTGEIELENLLPKR